MATVKKTVTSVSEDAEQLEHAYTAADGSVY